MVAIFAFLNFIFMKAVCEAMFSSGISVLAAALIAALQALGGFMAQLACIPRVANWRPGAPDADFPFDRWPVRETAGSFITATAASMAGAALVLFAFDERLWREVSRYGFEDMYWFAGVAAIPCIAHWFVSLGFFAKLNEN